MKEQRGILMFITSCMCGCGQMYQGYMKRGVSLLLGFFVIIAVSGFLMLGPLAFFTPVVWLYAFFDSYNLRRQIVQGTAPEDAYLFGPSLLVAPVMEAGQRQRSVYLPAGAQWTHVWSGETYEGGQTVTVAAPLEEIPVFTREKDLLPLFAEKK